MKRLYLSPPHMGPDERALLIDAFDSNWVAPLGPHVDAFEHELAHTTGVGHVAALSSGTAALHLALQLLGVGAGDEVFCASLTFAASANPITYLGASPVFLDSERRTWNLDPALLEEALEGAQKRGRLPKAVIAVDLYGQCADYARLAPLCARFGVPLVEDAAEALGAHAHGRPAGSFGRLAVLSFNGNKIITTSGGGALLSAEEEPVKRARFLATQARDPAPHYEHSVVGNNYRLSNLLAAVGRGQLRHLNDRVRRKRELFTGYQRLLADLDGIGFIPVANPDEWNAWLSVITIDPRRFGADREAVRLALEAENIESRPVWKPMHLQPVFRGCRTLGGAVSEAAFETGLCLPSGTAMSDAELERVAGVIRKQQRPAAHAATGR